MSKITLTELDRDTVARKRWQRLLLLSICTSLTLLDVLKQDAFYQFTIDRLLPHPEHRTPQWVAGIQLAQELLASVMQMLVALVEPHLAPSVWFLFSCSFSIIAWSLHFSSWMSLGHSVAVFVFRVMTMRYSMVVHWLGPRYHKHTILVQFFVALLPQVMKLPILRYYPDILFAQQRPLASLAVVLVAVYVLVHGVALRRSLQRDQPVDTPAKCQEAGAALDKSGTWLCNYINAVFLAAVYYDFPMFAAYMLLTLRLNLTYNLVYVHVALFGSVFLVNCLYNLHKHLLRLRLRVSYAMPGDEIHRCLDRVRFAWIFFSLFAALISRVAFLSLQLSGVRSFTAVVACAACGGLGGNVQPLLAEIMFRRRSPQTPRRRELAFSDRLFKWFYLDGRNLISGALFFIWLAAHHLLEPWWFSSVSVALLCKALVLTVLYHRWYGRLRNHTPPISM